MEQAAIFNMYTEAGQTCKLRQPIVYSLKLIKPEEGGYLAYAGSGGEVVVRPPQSVGERIAKFGLEDNSQWDITIEWQLKHMHEDCQTWTWSKGELRFVYEFAETNVINVHRSLWPMNISHEGFHRGKSRNLLLEGLFSGCFDAATHSRRLAWIDAHNWHPKYKKKLRNGLANAFLFAGVFRPRH